MTNDAAMIQATTAPSGAKTLADGTLRITVEIPPGDANNAFALFGRPGVTVVLARLSDAVAKQQAQQEIIAQDEADRRATGEFYNKLHAHGWFNNPAIARVAGSDAEYLAWLRSQPCCYCKADHEPSEAAHVRRVANGAGTGIKPPYSAISLCHQHHALQHQHGESALGGKDWSDRQLGRQRTEWIKSRLYAMLEVTSLTECPPEQFIELCCDLGIEHTLPR
jgi:hypothetical protein